VVRLGGVPIDIPELRWGSGMSEGESFTDTLRTVTGVVGGVVCRTPFRLDRDLVARTSASPFANAGDGDGEHPTQALIDFLAIEERGPVRDLRVAVCGDLRSRSPRSLIKLLDKMQPAALILIAPPGRDDPGLTLTASLQSRTTTRSDADFSGVDVLYMAGLREGTGPTRLGEEARSAFALTSRRMQALPGDAVVLSPMPVIDEITPEAWADPRVRVFAQSDRGVSVRMAVLSLLLPYS
jgi:aspartate carbamoyltransferase catalytic subunit